MHPDIQIVEEAHCVWHILPLRTHPGLKKLGGGLVGFGTLVTAFMVFWMWGPVSEGLALIAKGERFGIFVLTFGLFGLVGLLTGLGFLVLGAGLIAGRTHGRVGLTDNGIRCREYVGPLHWTWKRSAFDISGIQGLKDSKMFVDDARGRRAVPVQMLKELVFVEASCPGKKRRIPLVIGYPEPLARAMIKRVEAHLNSSAERYGAGYEEISTQWVDGSDKQHRTVPRPENTRIIKEPYADGVTFIIPPPGLIKGSKGLFFFAVVWNLFMAFFTAGSISGSWSGSEVGLVLFLALFWAIGIGLMVGAVSMGRRKVAIKAADGQLYILRQGLGKPKKSSWAFHELEEIRMGDSGMEVNDRPVRELQVFPKAGKKFGCLSHLPEPEIEWVACELRKVVFPA